MGHAPCALFTQPVYQLPKAVALTVSNTAVAITASSIPTDASGFIVSNAVGAGTVTWLFGVDPTTTLGHPMAAGESLVVEDTEAIGSFRFIRQGGSDGTLTFQFLAVKNQR